MRLSAKPPEVFELFQKDNQEIPDCSPAGEPCGGMPDAEPEFGPGDGVIFSIMEDRKKQSTVYKCPGCGTDTDYRGTGVCSACESKGLWVDPAGGVHTDDEGDPAAMYE